MARVRYVTPEELSPENKDVTWRDRPMHRALANSLDGARLQRHRALDPLQEQARRTPARAGDSADRLRRFLTL